MRRHRVEHDQSEPADAAVELHEFGDTRKGVITDLFVRRRLEDESPLRGIDAPRDPALEHFDALVAGALMDPRER